jgi:hypothetical protein
LESKTEREAKMGNELEKKKKRNVEEKKNGGKRERNIDKGKRAER